MAGVTGAYCIVLPGGMSNPLSGALVLFEFPGPGSLMKPLSPQSGL